MELRYRRIWQEYKDRCGLLQARVRILAQLRVCLYGWVILRTSPSVLRNLCLGCIVLEIRLHQKLWAALKCSSQLGDHRTFSTNRALATFSPISKKGKPPPRTVFTKKYYPMSGPATTLLVLDRQWVAYMPFVMKSQFIVNNFKDLGK